MFPFSRSAGHRHQSCIPSGMHGIKKRTIKLKLAGTALKSPGTAQKTGKKGTSRRVEVSRFYLISFPYLELLHTIVTFPYKLFCYIARFSLNNGEHCDWLVLGHMPLIEVKYIPTGIQLRSCCPHVEFCYSVDCIYP